MFSNNINLDYVRKMNMNNQHHNKYQSPMRNNKTHSTPKLYQASALEADKMPFMNI